MSRKKKKRKTLEELLEEALVPEEEQPYPVPENWVWVRLGSVGEIGSSKRVLKSDWKDDGIPFYRAREIVKLNKNEKIKNGIFITESLYNELKEKYGVPKENDLLITAVGTIGVPYQVKSNDKFYFKDASVIWYKNKYNLNSRYIKLFYETNIAQNQIKNMSAGTTVDTYTISNAKRTMVPLPPLNEQKRIASKVERLLNKIDQAKRLIEKAKETFERRRAAIIKELIDNAVSKTSSNEIVFKTLNEVYHVFGGGTPSKTNKDYWNGTVNWFTPKDIKTIYLKDSIDKITKLGVENSSAKMAKKGSIVVVTRSGILRHSLPVAKLMVDATVNQDLKVFSSENQLLNDFLLWYIQANERDLLNRFTKSGTTVNSLEFNRFKSLRIPILPDNLLCELLGNIENVISKEDTIFQLLDMEEHLVSLKQSILSKAFRGELGTNDPLEESAIELLKEVLQEQMK